MQREMIHFWGWFSAIVRLKYNEKAHKQFLAAKCLENAMNGVEVEALCI